MQLFYTTDIVGPTFSLNEEESKHCSRVLRLKEGDLLHLTNGIGTIYTAQIISPGMKKVVVTIVKEQTEFEKRPYRLHMAVAPTKNIDRFEWFLEKATEIGIDEITPIITEHSERKMVKPDRLEKVIIAAMKQSLKAYKPVLKPEMKFSEFISSQANHPNKFIAHCENSEKINLKEACKLGAEVLILIGPEGDFSREEIEMASSMGYIPVSLGTSRLRTETAAVVACHTVNLMNVL
jgi:16S rRNA (uracil1498-N3)-methyltransferase